MDSNANMANSILFLFGLFLIAVGVWEASLSLDDLWKRHERGMLANGLASQRTVEWERRARHGSWVGIGGGIFLWIFALLIAVESAPMSGVTINGHPLTKAEWDACGHDEVNYLNRHPSELHGPITVEK